MTTEHATREQPAPEGKGRMIGLLVMSDIAARVQEGTIKYGEPLKAHNGRDALVDAYQEALDLAQYLRQEIEERGDPIRIGARDLEVVWWLVLRAGFITMMPGPFEPPKIDEVRHLIQALHSHYRGGRDVPTEEAFGTVVGSTDHELAKDQAGG